jgi:hypothetical protein
MAWQFARPNFTIYANFSVMTFGWALNFSEVISFTHLRSLLPRLPVNYILTAAQKLWLSFVKLLAGHTEMSSHLLLIGFVVRSHTPEVLAIR